MKKAFALILFLWACQTGQVKESNLTPIINATKEEIKNDDRLDHKTKERYVTVLDSCNSENLGLRETLTEQEIHIANLNKKLEELQKNYAESQKDACWKNLILWAFWGFIGVFVLWNLAKFAKNRFSPL